MTVVCLCVDVCRSGTDFVFQDFHQTEEEAVPPHLPYLTVLAEFSCKLLKPDKRALWVSVRLHPSI